MAFVYKSERFNTDNVEVTIGPGNYDLIKGNNSKRKQSAAPFNVKAQRKGAYIDNNTPGPGAYLRNRRFITKSAFNVNRTKPDKACSSGNENNNNNDDEEKEYLFISAAPRFKEVNGVKKDMIPGPGYYDVLGNKKVRKKVYLYERSAPRYETYQNERVLSIPHRSFGYIEDGKGNFVSVDDPDKEFKYSGNRNDSVGPDRYNTETRRRNVSVIDWSLSKKDKFHSVDDNNNNNTSNNNTNNDYDTINIDNSSTKANVIIKKQSTLVKNIFKSYQRNYNNNNSDSNILFDFEKEEIKKQNLKKNPVPGPGAYSPALAGELYKYFPKDKRYQNFGSSSSRLFSGSFNTNQSLISLDHYNNNNSYTTNNTHQINQNNSHKIINKSTTSKTISTEPSSTKIVYKDNFKVKLGPGSYNPTLDIYRPSSNIGNFNTLEKRFPITNTESTPGAGAYINIDTWSPEHKSQQHKLKTSGEIIMNNHKYAPVKLIKENINSPGVGHYDASNFGSIEFKIKQRQLNKKLPPFLGSEKRFKLQQHVNPQLGPGRYNIRKDILSSNVNQLEIPFMVSSKRKSNYKINDVVGPGEYDHSSYFDWNKKSYNSLFV